MAALQLVALHTGAMPCRLRQQAWALANGARVASRRRQRLRTATATWTDCCKASRRGRRPAAGGAPARRAAGVAGARALPPSRIPRPGPAATPPPRTHHLGSTPPGAAPRRAPARVATGRRRRRRPSSTTRSLRPRPRRRLSWKRARCLRHGSAASSTRPCTRATSPCRAAPSGRHCGATCLRQAATRSCRPLRPSCWWRATRTSGRWQRRSTLRCAAGLVGGGAAPAPASARPRLAELASKCREHARSLLTVL